MNPFILSQIPSTMPESGAEGGAGHLQDFFSNSQLTEVIILVRYATTHIYVPYNLYLSRKYLRLVKHSLNGQKDGFSLVNSSCADQSAGPAGGNTKKKWQRSPPSDDHSTGLGAALRERLAQPPLVGERVEALHLRDSDPAE